MKIYRRQNGFIIELPGCDTTKYFNVRFSENISTLCLGTSRLLNLLDVGVLFHFRESRAPNTVLRATIVPSIAYKQKYIQYRATLTNDHKLSG